MKTIFQLFITILLSLDSLAQADTSIILPSEQEISIEEYGKKTAKYQLLWIHSERGISKELRNTLANIGAQQDIHVILPDWLDSYFITPSRSSLENIPQQDFEDLLIHYLKPKDITQKKLFIAASGRAASLVLNAAHHIQTQGIDSIAGLIMIAPYLQTQTPEIGKPADYQQITSFSNLPLFVFQAERSPRFVPFSRLVKELEKGGSPVYTHILKNIRGGFHARDENDLTRRDFKAREEFPKYILNALSLLEQTQKAPLKEITSYKKNIRKKKQTRLQQVVMKTPVLALNDIQGKSHKLTDYKGKVVLISFWATWCRPCLEEMPSLVKLKEKYADKLEILAVNIREDKSTIMKFTEPMKINFPLLQDKNSEMVKSWKVYVYPSNYIVDKEGNLRYAATGAMDWQGNEEQATIESLF